MKKTKYTLFFILSLIISLSSCSGDSYEKRVKKQKEAIKNFMSDKEILYTYPADHHFDDNQYYKEPDTNIYYQVLDAGNLTDSMTVDDKTKGNIPVTLLFDSVTYLVSNVKYIGNYVQDGTPISFNYGNVNSYTNTTSGTFAYAYLSQTLVLPLDKGIGPGAIVNIIVPFQNGSSYQQSYYEPFFFEKLRYSYYKQAN